KICQRVIPNGLVYTDVENGRTNRRSEPARTIRQQNGDCVGQGILGAGFEQDKVFVPIMIHIHVHEIAVRGVENRVHLPSAEVAEVTPGGPAKSPLTVVEIDAYRIRPLICANKVRVAVT